MRIELMTPGLQDQCSSHWAMKPSMCVLELLDSDLSQLRQRTTLSRLGRCNRWQPMNMEVRGEVERERWQSEEKKSLSAGFEPARAEPNRFLVYRLNHSATTTCIKIAQDTGPNWGYFTDTITKTSRSIQSQLQVTLTNRRLRYPNDTWPFYLQFGY